MNALDFAHQKNRLEYLDILRGLGIIFILIRHIYYNETVLRWLDSFDIQVFFFAAGAVYKIKPILTDLKRRAESIVVPYFSFGSLELIYWQLLERRFRPSEISFGNSLFGLLTGQYDYLEFNSHLWFLPCFFITVVFYNIIMNIGGKKLAYAVSAAMSIIFAVLPMPELFWGINRVFRYIGFYAVGHIVSETKIAEKIGKQKTVIKISEAIVLLVLSFVLSFFGLTSGVMMFVTALAAVGGLFIFSLIIVKCRPLQYLGRISIVILCIHGVIYRPLIKLVSIFTGTVTDIVRGKLYWVIPITVLTLVICSGVYEIIIRTVPVIIGKRRKRKA